jgi:outer membrane efflux protein
MVLFLACMAAASPARPQETLSLDQAVTLALKANRSIQTADLEVKKAGDQIAAERTRRLPSLSLSTLAAQRVTALDFRFDRGAFGVYPGIGPIPGENTSIHSPLKPAALIIGQIGQPLTQQYKIGLSLAQLRLGSEIAGEQRRAQRQAVCRMPE